MVQTKPGTEITKTNYISANHFIEKRPAKIAVSSNMAKSVSQYRRNFLEEETIQGKFQNDDRFIDQKQMNQNIFSPTPAGFVTSNARSNISKFGNSTSVGVGAGSGTGYRGSGGTLRQSPDIYNPLWLNSNLNLPRDRATINAWSRAYFALNGLVQNAISLHSTYPISKLNIKCKNPYVEKFHADMIEEIDLMNICVQIAQEYWILGEAFVYAELDEANRKWSRLLIQNPDYIVVQRSVVADEPIISLRPDDNLQRICKSNRPADIQQRQKLDKSIIEHVKRGENIPLSNFYVSHLARKTNPYDARGTGLIVSSFRQLMLFDKLRECYSTDCEILTSDGFKYIDELIENSSSLNINPNYIVGTDVESKSLVTLKSNVKIACVNSDTNEIEYHAPLEFHMSKYQGKMLHFSGKKIDTLVTPNHKMWVKEQKNNKWEEFKKLQAKELLEKKKYWKFNSKAKYVTGVDVKSVNVCDKEVPIDLYLKVLGYVVSEGCVHENFENEIYDAKICLNQLTSSDCFEDMKTLFEAFADKLNKKAVSTIKDKHLPRWVLNLKPELLKIILNSLVLGNKSEYISKYESESFKYSTISKQLADDVYELVYKCGFVPNICVSTTKKSDDRIVTEYVVLWSTTDYDNEPLVYTGQKFQKNNGGVASVNEIDYDGVVWCFEVPTGLFITRRNGKIGIHGNSKFAQADNMINPLTLVKIGGEDYKPSPTDLDAWRQVFEEAQNDKDFKIFTHDKVAVERVGHNGGIIDISSDITQLIKEIFIGLLVPSVLMDGGADTTYANGGVALDILRQRYMQFRNMLTVWLRRKIFAPISKINDFYEYVDKKKVLIVPDIEWNHMSLFDAGDYITILKEMVTGEKKHASHQTLYRSLGLSYDDELQKMRKEEIDDVIKFKEKEALDGMSLNELRALGPSDEIQESTHSPLPGEQSNVPATSGDDGLPGVPPSPDTPPNPTK